MNAEFNWWLLIVGLVLGAGLVWLVLADSRRREADVTESERASEARWIAEALADAGRPLEDDEVLDVLRLHAEYLGQGPPDELLADDPGEDLLIARTDHPPGRPEPEVVRPTMSHPIARTDDGEGGLA